VLFAACHWLCQCLVQWSHFVPEQCFPITLTEALAKPVAHFSGANPPASPPRATGILPVPPRHIGHGASGPGKLNRISHRPPPVGVAGLLPSAFPLPPSAFRSFPRLQSRYLCAGGKNRLFRSYC
jgi:hypothetical protein